MYTGAQAPISPRKPLNSAIVSQSPGWRGNYRVSDDWNRSVHGTIKVPRALFLSHGLVAAAVLGVFVAVDLLAHRQPLLRQLPPLAVDVHPAILRVPAAPPGGAFRLSAINEYCPIHLISGEWG